ncbi:replicative DNA helicase [Fontibacillus solani]|uniref:Replicative DNA helicase n=1 Tax=Fontibacillus solani TaxID=1572857 RepID=A0A7W3SUJ5_9BACL|nr:replicative DNA helicase [Fontibacillus solani]MBA9086531.1 replicative DNA helicase [Fontibacillus solani]
MNLSGSGTLNYELPVALDSEQVVLGCLIYTADLINTFQEKGEEEAFSTSQHRAVYEALIELHSNDKPIDIVTLTACLKARGQLELVGGVSYLQRLHGSIVMTHNFDFHFREIMKYLLLRRIVRASIQQIRTATEDQDVDQALLKMQQNVDILSNQASPPKELVPIEEAVVRYFEELELRALCRGDRQVTGAPSGFDDLDKMTSGFQRGDLIIVAARPGVGKTAFALNIAQAASKVVDDPVAFFSLEMSESQLVQRSVASDGNVDASRLREGRLDDSDWTRVVDSISGMKNIYLDETPGISVAEIRAKCRRLKKRAGLSMIVIDYLQLIAGRGRNENRQQEVSEISRTLKLIARELEVPVIALSQLSRGVEQRQDKRPMLSDLRESGSIEQDADIVAFLYRDDYYNQESEKKNIIEIIIAKQRNGPIGTVELVFLKNFNKFANYERAHSEVGST